MKTAIKLISDERKRQIEVEGHTPELDDKLNSNQELACAASIYSMPLLPRWRITKLWPWSTNQYKTSLIYDPKSRIRELVKSGALIVAEIERLQRKEESDGH